MTVPLDFKSTALSLTRFYSGFSRGTEPREWIYYPPKPPPHATHTQTHQILLSFKIVIMAYYTWCAENLSSPWGWMPREQSKMAFTSGWQRPPPQLPSDKAWCPSSPSLVPRPQEVSGEPLVPIEQRKLGNTSSPVSEVSAAAVIIWQINSIRQRKEQACTGQNKFHSSQGCYPKLVWAFPHQSETIRIIL